MVNPMDLTGKSILFIRDSSSLNSAIIDQLRILGGKVTILESLQISTTEPIVKEIVRKNGPFDGLVYGIVHSDFRPIRFINPEITDMLMHDNYGIFIEVIRVLIKSKGLRNGASVVAMSSISSIRAMKAKTVFCSAKAALDAAVRCLAAELGDKGIRVNSVQKGGVDTDLEKAHIQDVTALNNNATKCRQILSLTKAMEVANVVAFLISDATHTITGTSIIIDGGYTL